MTPADDRILELLEAEGQYPPKIIADRLDMHSHYVGERCRILRDHGLLRKLGRGLYQITDSGEKYLAGELDTTELDDTSDEWTASA
jgi:predicted transcriptional regulator